MSYLENYMQDMQRQAANRPKVSPQVNPVPPPVPPLVEQVRNLLANLPPAQKERISLPMLLPHLCGKYRDLPNHVGVARALRSLGYRQIRSFKKADGASGTRYWIKKEG